MSENNNTLYECEGCRKLYKLNTLNYVSMIGTRIINRLLCTECKNFEFSEFDKYGIIKDRHEKDIRS